MRAQTVLLSKMDLFSKEEEPAAMPDDAPHDAIDTPRLTSLSHGGGCGCKLAPAVLRDILSSMPAASGFTDLLVGTETSDDAAVWRVNPDQAIVATTDFFMPIVDDPYDFGRIAATNAISDIYAMGATPLFSLAIVGMPIDILPPDVIRKILEGGASICAEAGVPIAGGHSIDSREPIYGLIAIGLVHPDKLLSNRAAQAGDVLILTKPLGVGVYSAALKKDALSDEGYAAMIGSTTKLNTIGKDLGAIPGVHAVTDVTGFGLIGHSLEMARGSGLTAVLNASGARFLPGVEDLAQAGVKTGAAGRNWKSCEDAVSVADDVPLWRRELLCDPQTSGGLLVAVSPDDATAVLDLASSAGFADAAIVGRLEDGAAQVRVEA